MTLVQVGLRLGYTAAPSLGQLPWELYASGKQAEPKDLASSFYKYSAAQWLAGVLLSEGLPLQPQEKVPFLWAARKGVSSAGGSWEAVCGVFLMSRNCLASGLILLHYLRAFKWLNLGTLVPKSA